MNSTLKTILAIAALGLVLAASVQKPPQPVGKPARKAEARSFAFVHPGILLTRADLDRMKEMVAEGAEPWKSGFERLRIHPQSQSTYALRGAFPEIGRNPTVRQSEYEADANAAYQCALMWYITGDSVYANKSKAILNAWASALKIISGADASLAASLHTFKLVNAAEILRYTDAGWSDEEIRQCERMFKDVFYPVLKDFALYANGNWDTAAVKTVMAIGIFSNDRAMFERGLRYYVNGAGDGRLTYYIYENGQCQESGRDQSHAQLGLAHLGDASEMAWNQGLNLYACADNRLLKGFEYAAKYNLGEKTEFIPDLDRTGKYAHGEISPRGPFRPVFEQIYNHYVNRRGLPAPFTQRAAERLRPEGAAAGSDHPGFGTLLFSRQPAADPAEVRPPAPPSAPGGIITQGSRSGIALSWVAPVNAASYTVKRAAAGGGPYTTIALGVKSTTYTDVKVTPGAVYRYAVSASNSAGESPDAFEASAGAGLPSPWSQRDVGDVSVVGAASYDGRAFTIEGAGTDIGGAGDQFQFACVPMTGDGTITARFVPQVASQSAKMGVMMRETFAADSAHAALLLMPAPAGAGEQAGWGARLVTRASSGADSWIEAGPNLPPPYVTYGRLMQPCWLRLVRSGNTFTGSISPDGQTWSQVGSSTIPLKRGILAGLSVCSRLGKVSTAVSFDNVTAPDWGLSLAPRGKKGD